MGRGGAAVGEALAMLALPGMAGALAMLALPGMAGAAPPPPPRLPAPHTMELPTEPLPLRPQPDGTLHHVDTEARFVGIVHPDGRVEFRDLPGTEVEIRTPLAVTNWLVGMAAFLATMGRTIIGKYIPVLITVMAFVASGFMHSPANMGFLSLIQPLGDGPGWAAGLAWAVAPAAIGNVAGAFFLVALPFWLVRRPR